MTEDFRQAYLRFIDQTLETGVVWNLIHSDGFAICESEQSANISVMPFWSSKTEAQAACTDEWQDYRPNPLEFDDFIDHWLHGMAEDEVYVGINWTDELAGVEIEPVILIDDLLADDD